MTDRTNDGMTKAERDELARLVRRREKLAKADADQVGAERLASLERQLAAIYKPADDPIWAEATKLADEAVTKAQQDIDQRCGELGIPEDCAPGIQMGWYGRGETAAAQRRAELRKVAQTRITADAKAAKVAIERQSVEIQTQLVAGGLESGEAQQFLASMPTAEALMPAISVAEIEATLPAGASR